MDAISDIFCRRNLLSFNWVELLGNRVNMYNMSVQNCVTDWLTICICIKRPCRIVELSRLFKRYSWSCSSKTFYNMVVSLCIPLIMYFSLHNGLIVRLMLAIECSSRLPPLSSKKRRNQETKKPRQHIFMLNERSPPTPQHSDSFPRGWSTGGMVGGGRLHRESGFQGQFNRGCRK